MSSFFRCASQAVLDILWGRKALVVEEDGELHQRRGKLDEADAMYLRCLMRRYGWEQHDEECASLLMDGMRQAVHLQQEQVSAIRMVFGSRIIAHADFHCFGSLAQSPRSNGGARNACFQDDVLLFSD